MPKLALVFDQFQLISEHLFVDLEVLPRYNAMILTSIIFVEMFSWIINWWFLLNIKTSKNAMQDIIMFGLKYKAAILNYMIW